WPGFAIIFLAEDEQYHVGILLDGAGFAQIRKLRALVLALLDLAGKLGKRQNWDVQLLGKRLQASGDLGDLLHAPLGGAAGRPGEEPEIIDAEQADAAPGVQGPGPRRQRRPP